MLRYEINQIEDALGSLKNSHEFLKEHSFLVSVLDKALERGYAVSGEFSDINELADSLNYSIKFYSEGNKNLSDF